jgi:hypothetical protein
MSENDKGLKLQKMKELLEEKIKESSDENGIRRLKTKLNWIETYTELFSDDENFDEELIEKSKFDVESSYLEKGDKMYSFDLPFSFMEKYKEDLNWIKISKTQKLTSEFIIKNKDLINFDSLSSYNYFQLEGSEIENLINNDTNLDNPFSDSINWSSISMREDLSIDFIRKFKDKLNWSYLSINCDFTEDQLVEFKDNIDWEKAVICQSYSDDFKEKYNLDEFISSIKETSTNKFEERERIYERISSGNGATSERGYDIRRTQEERDNDPTSSE